MGWGPGTPAARPYQKSWQVTFLRAKHATEATNQMYFIDGKAVERSSVN